VEEIISGDLFSTDNFSCFKDHTSSAAPSLAASLRRGGHLPTRRREIGLRHNPGKPEKF
jgi:hypothetical protein